MSRTSKGRAIVNLLELREGERTCAYLNVKNFEESSHYLTFVSTRRHREAHRAQGLPQRQQERLIAVGLKEGDALLDVTLTGGSDDILLARANGMAIRFNERTSA
jgi:DNA gyrase subunit A